MSLTFKDARFSSRGCEGQEVDRRPPGFATDSVGRLSTEKMRYHL